MKLVVGLGNPGARYEHTRHNVGFVVVTELARRWRLAAPRYDRDFQGMLWDAQRGDERVLMLMPQTYMNLSGQSVGAVQRFYKLAPQDMLVACDDVDLPVGTIRLRPSGSSGGQKGLGDILARLGTQDVPRLRIGIGKVHSSATVEHVLSTFAPDELPAIGHALATAVDAAECWLAEGMSAAMNRFNRRPGRKNGPSEAGGEGRSSRGEPS